VAVRQRDHQFLGEQRVSGESGWEIRGRRGEREVQFTGAQAVKHVARRAGPQPDLHGRIAPMELGKAARQVKWFQRLDRAQHHAAPHQTRELVQVSADTVQFVEDALNPRVEKFAGVGQADTLTVASGRVWRQAR
jgi:hypothetical protein